MAIDVDFKCNLSIPNYVGIGKNASMGYGVIHQLREKKEKQNTEEREEVVTQENNQ